MAQRLVKYKLEGDGSVPKWIAEGGHWKEGEEFIGLTVEDEKYWVPSGLVEIDDTMLEARIKKLSPKKEDSLDKTDKEVKHELKEWKKAAKIEKRS